MKAKSIIVLLILALLTISCKSEKEMKGTFLFNPEHPNLEEEITIKYNSVGTDLGEAYSVDAIIYSYSADIEETTEIEMSKKGSLWTAKFAPNEKTKGLLIVFKNGETKDNNNEQGYNIKLYKDGKVVPGALAGLAVLHKRYARLIGFKGDAELAKLLIEEEFETNPSVKSDYLRAYFMTLPRSKRDSVVGLELEAIEEEGNLSEKNLELLAVFFPMTGDIVKGTKYTELLTEKFPKSDFTQDIAYRKLSEEKNIDKRIILLKEAIEKFPNEKITKWMLYSTVNELGKTKKFNKAKDLTEQFPKLVTSRLYNSLAWMMFENKTQLSTAVGLAEKGVELARKEIEVNDDKPKFYTDSQWNEQKQMSLGMTLDTYANILTATNQKEKALSLFEEAIEVTKEQQAFINENYASLLVDLGKQEKAKEVLKRFIDSGKSNDEIVSLYSKVFVELGGSDDDLNKYFSKNSDESNKQITEKLKKEILNKPAPQFTLVDVEGKSVSLADFKGKIVVLDFWATWCGPCLASFPAMKKAQNKLSKNNEVKFLFINTREQAEDKTKKVKDFLIKNNYPFHVLMDEKNEVLAQYDVPGIPTKFVIDKNGNIRFKSVGFGGNAEELIMELEQMVSMIK